MIDQLPDAVDMLVIGGGITGAGIARDAAMRGLRTAVVEMGDLASGTSSRSSKLVHGGLRYLEHYEFSLVFEAVSERRILLDLAPHLVNPLGFVFPVYEGSRHKLWFIEAGMWLYDGLSLFRSPKLHKKLGMEELQKLEPSLSSVGLQGAPLYYDCSTDDARLTLETALDAVERGACVATYSRVEKLLHDERGRAVGAVIRDVLDNTVREIRAQVVVNASGPWTDSVLTLGQHTIPPGGPGTSNLLRPTKGVHIVVPFEKLPVNHAVVCLHPADQRVLFAIPWGEHTYLGTTDTDYSGDPGVVSASREDVTYLIAAAREYFPGHPLTDGDVVSTWAGVRPLIAPPQADGSEASSVSREHQIIVGSNGVLTVAGGKLTTYRKMAREVVDTAVDLLKLSGFVRELLPSATEKEPLPGARGWPASDDVDEVAAEVRSVSRGVIAPASARMLANRYGMRALTVAERCAQDKTAAEPLIGGRPELVGEVAIAVEEELAATVGDFLERRTQIFYRISDQGAEVAPRVAALMAPLCGWSSEEERDHTERYQQSAKRAQAWRPS